MSATDGGGPAFPRPNFHSDTHHTAPAQDGMALRDWFAGQALGGIVVATAHSLGYTVQDAAEEAYQFADAMLTERAKSQ